jgi:enamine deaminase RidA (YjgF/YER057c/UK114 family)
MKRNNAVLAALAIVLGASAQSTVKHIQTPDAAIASAVWAGDTLYVSGQLPSPVTPADRDKGTPAVYGDTKTQTANAVEIEVTAVKPR